MSRLHASLFVLVMCAAPMAHAEDAPVYDASGRYAGTYFCAAKRGFYVTFDEATQKHVSGDAPDEEQMFIVWIELDTIIPIEQAGKSYRAAAYKVMVSRDSKQDRAARCNPVGPIKASTPPGHEGSVFVDQSGIECSTGYRTHSINFDTLLSNVILNDGSDHPPFTGAACLKSD